MMVRKIKNISEVTVPIQLSGQTTVMVAPGVEMKNVDVSNLVAIQGFVSAEYDLSEVQPVKEGRQMLHG